MATSRGAICDARCQQFHREATAKQERLKTRWFIRNQQRLYDNAATERFSEKLHQLKEEQKRRRRERVEAELAERRSGGPKAKPPEKPLLPAWRPSPEDLGQMRPIKKDILDLLYAPADASFMCKAKYLHERYKSKPEDRYYYPYASSWIFGWRLKDYPEESRDVDYGVKSIIQSSFYRRNASSLQRDPDWYRICQTGDPNNFNEILTY